MGKKSSAAAAVAEIERPAPASGKRVLLRATLFTPRGAYTVWIRDISASSANVTCGDRLPPACDVILKRGEFFAAARLAGSNESGAQVIFYRALNEGDLDLALLPQPSGGD